MLQGRIDLLARFRETFRNSVGEKLILTPKVFVKPADSQTRCLHNACDAGTAQPLSAELASSISHNTITGSRLMFRFVTHISLLDYTDNPQAQIVSFRLALRPSFYEGTAVPEANIAFEREVLPRV